MRLEFETGEPIPGFEWISDQDGAFHAYLGDGDETLPYAGFIDWYGDTSFSSYQMPMFMRDWKKIMAVASQEHQVVLSKVLKLAEACEEGNSWHLKFYGD